MTYVLLGEVGDICTSWGGTLPVVITSYNADVMFITPCKVVITSVLVNYFTITISLVQAFNFKIQETLFMSLFASTETLPQ